MRDDFAIFILSHGRADTMTTAQAILNAGYTGKWFVIIDDLDEQKDLYIENYGERVIVFDKKLWDEKTDTITNTGDLRSVVFARNASYEIARDMGLNFFAEFDDDLTVFRFRYDESGTLKGKKIINLDSVIEAMIEFQAYSKAVSVGFACDGGFIGGTEGKFKQGILRSVHQAFILRTDMPIEFKGLINEDGIVTEYCNSTGKLALEITCITQMSPVRSRNSGGLQDLYKANDEYVRAFYSVIAYPNNLKIFERKGSIALKRKSDLAIPKIVNERWKKCYA